MNVQRSTLTVGIASFILLASCVAKDKGIDQLTDISGNVRKQLSFTCSQEKDRISPRDVEADRLYQRARWLVKGNNLKQDPSVYPEIERLLRVATAYGNDKANIELRDMLEKSQAVSLDPVNEVIDLTQDLIHRGIPSGYYSMGWYLEHGYGVRADQELAFKYYRKSADLGSPDGQYLVGDKLTDASAYGMEIANIGLAMWRCAGDQHHAKAANMTAVRMQAAQRAYVDAIKYYRIAASEGLAVAASSLSGAFSVKDHADPLWGLGQAIDLERQARYYKVSDFLSDYDYLNATVYELDTIVPPPPAKLPAWDGKFVWLEEHKANVAPTIPSEERIAEMARAKGLDPKTGRAVKAKP